MVEELLEGTAPAFLELPAQALEVHAVPEYIQDTAPGAYYDMPSIDGSRPGIFNVDLREPGDVRLVVDTGIHDKKWPRQKAIDYMLHYTGMPESEVIPEIDRYIVMPAQACAYMIGMLEILAMREEARGRLQEGFDLAEFHQVVLGNGPLPLQVLREQVRQMRAL